METPSLNRLTHATTIPNTFLRVLPHWTTALPLSPGDVSISFYQALTTAITGGHLSKVTYGSSGGRWCIAWLAQLISLACTGPWLLIAFDMPVHTTNKKENLWTHPAAIDSRQATTIANTFRRIQPHWMAGLPLWNMIDFILSGANDSDHQWPPHPRHLRVQWWPLVHRLVRLELLLLVSCRYPRALRMES